MTTATATHEWTSTLIGSTGLAVGGCSCLWSLVGTNAAAVHAAVIAHAAGNPCKYQWADTKWHDCKLAKGHDGDHLCVEDVAEYENEEAA